MKSKALFLLVVFLLNTIVGFACAVTMESGHTHSEAHSHNHTAHQHQHTTHHSHSSVAKKQSSDKSGKHGCCKDEVSKFNSLAKIAGQAGKINTKAPVVELTPIFFAGEPLIIKSAGYSNYIVNRQRPPNSKIRILIQSFQI